MPFALRHDAGDDEGNGDEVDMELTRHNSCSEGKEAKIDWRGKVEKESSEVECGGRDAFQVA